MAATCSIGCFATSRVLDAAPLVHGIKLASTIKITNQVTRGNWSVVALVLLADAGSWRHLFKRRPPCGYINDTSCAKVRQGKRRSCRRGLCAWRTCGSVSALMDTHHVLPKHRYEKFIPISTVNICFCTIQDTRNLNSVILAHTPRTRPQSWSRA